MIKVLEALLGKVSHERPGQKRMAISKPIRPNTGGDFRSVSVVPSLICCAAATQASGTPHLARHAPRLPLGACTMPTKCACKFGKRGDRREGDRRLFGGVEANRWFQGPENRKNRTRRSATR